MENVSHKLNMQIEANFKEDFFEEEQGVVEKYFFHGDVLLTLNHVQNDLQLLQMFRLIRWSSDAPWYWSPRMCAETKQLLHLSSSGSYRSFNLNLDLRRNGRSPFNLYHLAARWKSIEISIVRQGNLEDVRLTKRNVLLIQTKEAWLHRADSRCLYFSSWFSSQFKS